MKGDHRHPPPRFSTPDPDPLTKKDVAHSIKEIRHNVGKVAVVRAPEKPTERKGGQHVHFRRLFEVNEGCDLPLPILAPPPVHRAYTLDLASRMSIEKDTGVNQASHPQYPGHTIADLPI